MPETSLTRRGLLAVVGTSAVAGCSGLDGLTGGQQDTIRAYDLPDIDEESALEPSVQPSVPVEIEESYLKTALGRTSSLLESLPLPLGPEHIPNGHIRTDLTDAAAAATDSVDEARSADTLFAALRALRYARKRARYAAAGWAFVDEGLTVDDARRAYRRSATDARSRRETHTYVGSDPVRAVLVHARIERALELASDGPDVHASRDRSGLLTVAAWGDEAESARALVADARHLDARFTASLPDDAETLEGPIRNAGERLLADIRSRQSALPPEPTAEEWSVEERVLDDLRRAATGGTQRIADAPGPATATVDANGRLASVLALQQIRPRLEADEQQVERAADIRSLRTNAYDELQRALRESPAPELARTVVTDAAGRVASADWELSRVRGETPVSRFDDITAGYLVATALARATPDACRNTVEVLRGS